MGQTTLSFWQLISLTILPAVIAAITALSSPVIAQIIQSKKHKNNDQLEKLSRIIELIHELDIWLDKKRSHLHFEKEAPAEQSPSSELQAMAYVYLPTLIKPVDELDLSVMEYIHWMIKTSRKLIEDKNTQMADDEFQKTYKKYLAARIQLKNDVVAVAKELRR